MKEYKVEPASDTWLSVSDAIQTAIKRHREARDQQGADLRTLDFHLGAIKALEDLERLPAKQAKKPPEPIRGSGVRVPGKSPLNW